MSSLLRHYYIHYYLLLRYYIIITYYYIPLLPIITVITNSLLPTIIRSIIGYNEYIITYY